MIQQLPFPEIKDADKEKLTDIVKQILATKSADPEADTSALETQIDNLVNQLYGLNAEYKVL